ncbi:hypothetical protein HN512_00975 [Candidatus Peregrinibacteria bacterium]|jgi:hypothetical protein|nr:hypothetical protein [Candidatus Peregrinibacteria bacterium]MBT3598391.1 hypothetical protein [Candidatus Peregrinibacteria bacterium]MBT4367428.1 hypothetical protein [Candidatus Peregrinibacteria bacterium]MBT4585662.1 hypothetical protein [Candidatus Peregrinibacteria bacterium]MBT6730428.1 hypothetical protein [Candidatus Peregrinibacteria bacterium]
MELALALFPCGSKTFNTIILQKNLYSITAIIVVSADCTIPSLGNDPSNTRGEIRNYGIMTAGTGEWTHDGYLRNYGTINTSLTTLDFSGSITSYTGATLTMSGTDIQVDDDFVYLGGTIPANIDLSINGVQNTTITCSGYSFNSVTLLKKLYSSAADIVISADCTIPSLGNDPSTRGDIRNYGTITIGTGEWTHDGYINNYGTINTSLTTIDLSWSFVSHTGGTLTMSSTDIQVDDDFKYLGGTIPANIDLSINGVQDTSLICSKYSFNSVTLLKNLSSQFANIVIGGDCTLPSIGNDPSTRGDIYNYGIINIGTGEWTHDGYLRNYATVNTSLTTIDLSYALSSYTGGVLTMNGTDIQVGTDFLIYGGSIPADIDVTFDSSSASNLRCANYSFDSITINKGTSTVDFNLLDGCATGDFSYTTGDWIIQAAVSELSVSGDFSMDANDTFGDSNMTVLFSGGNAQSFSKTTGTFGAVLNINKSANALTLATGLTTSGQVCTVEEGVFDLSGNAFSCGSTFTVENGGELHLEGGESVTTPVLDTGSSVTYNATSGTETINDWGYKDLVIDGSGGTFQFGATESIANNMTVTNGTIDFNGQTVGVSGDLTMGTGSQIISDADAMNGAAITVGGDLDLDGESGDLIAFKWTGAWSMDVTGNSDIDYASFETSGTTAMTLSVGGATATASYTDVEYSDASGGTAIDTSDGTNTDSGNTTNWGFDNTDPLTSSLSPLDESTEISVTANLVITFDEAVDPESGASNDIVIKKVSNDSIVETIDAEDAKVTGGGTTTITINPDATLDSETSYYVLVGSDAFDDSSGNSFAGISVSTTWNFTTTDTVSPTASLLSPLDEATGVSITDNLVITFDEVTGSTGTGYITIYDASDDSIVEQVNTGTGTVTGSGTTIITINPVNDFSYSTEYYVQIDANSIPDDYGNFFAGILDSTTWNFTTVSAPVAPATTADTPASGGGGGGGRRHSASAMADTIAAAHAAIIARYYQPDAQNEPIVVTQDIDQPDKDSSDEERHIYRAAQKTILHAAATKTDSKITEYRGYLISMIDDSPIIFKDVPSDSWFAPFVSELIENKIAQGYKDEDGKPKGEFGVANPVTFAEALKMTLEAVDSDLSSLPPPRNKSAIGTWATAYIAKAESLNLSLFSPERDVHSPATRGQIMQILLEVLKIPTGIKIASQYTDVRDNHPHRDAIVTATAYGLVSGDSDLDGNPLNKFRPNDQINRAEVAKIIAIAKEVIK